MSESSEQQALFEWATWNISRLPDLEWLHHVPNGGMRHKATAARLKREGVKAGAPDIYLDVARGGYHGLRIELKAGRNRPSAEQLRWGIALQQRGYSWHVCYGWFDAARVIVEYLRGDLEECGLR